MRRLILLLIVGGGVAGAYYSMHRPAGPLILTGIVTTENVVVGPQVGGQIGRLLVKEGDQVQKNQLVAVMTTDELQADRAYYMYQVASIQSQVETLMAAGVAKADAPVKLDTAAFRERYIKTPMQRQAFDKFFVRSVVEAAWPKEPAKS